jgi:type I restriction enzyme R subunit
VQQASCFEDKKLAVIEWVNELAVTIKAVQAQSSLITALGSAAWWLDADIAKLEAMRLAIRPIARFRTRRIEPGQGPLSIDLAEAREGIYEVERKVTITSHTEAMAYKAKVKQILAGMRDNNPTLQKIHLGQPVSDAELNSLTSQVLTSHPGVELSVLAEFYPNEAVDLQTAIRELVGLDPQHVEAKFAGFLHQHPGLTAKQVQYINLLKTYIADNGFILVDKLYQPPFTRLHEDGIDGVFQNQDAHELIAVLGPFLRPQTAPRAPESTH